MNVTHTTIRGWIILSFILLTGGVAIATITAGWWGLLAVSLTLGFAIVRGYATFLHHKLHDWPIGGPSKRKDVVSIPKVHDMKTGEVFSPTVRHDGSYVNGRYVCSCGQMSGPVTEDDGLDWFVGHVMKEALAEMERKS